MLNTFTRWADLRRPPNTHTPESVPRGKRLASSRIGRIAAIAGLLVGSVLYFAAANVADATQLVPGDSICLQNAANGMYVSADDFGLNPLVANRTSASTWESFTVLDAGGGNIHLRAQINQEYVCADNAGASPLIANRTAFGIWETFTEVDQSNGTVALRAMANGNYVTANSSGNQLIASSTSVSPWEEFTVRPIALSVFPKVYIGSQNGWQTLNNNASQWSFTAANADGFYANFIQLLPTVGTPGTWCNQSAAIMAHKNAYFESDSRYTGLGGFPNGGQYTIATEDQEMQEMISAGFNITYSSLNYGVDSAKLADCRTYGLPSGSERPCLAQNGPWQFGGNINSNVNNNASIRNDIANTEGESTDGPLDLWSSNNGGMQTGSTTVVQYAQSIGKLAMVMISPGQLSPSQYLSTAQQCVRYQENNGAKPEIWSNFAYDTATPTVPESNSDGSAANTVTGSAYWLIHHIADPVHWARLTMPNTDGIRLCSAPVVLSEASRVATAQTESTPMERTEAQIAVPVTRSKSGSLSATRVVDLSLHNESTWLDLCPVLCAEVVDPGKNWTVGFRLGGKDITKSVLSGDGFVFIKDQRLWPNASKHLQLTLTYRGGDARMTGIAHPAASDSPVTVMIGLLAGPYRRDKINEALTIHATAQDPSQRVAGVAVGTSVKA